jgi:hypothetical protein
MRSFTDKADLKQFYTDPRVQAIPKSFINGVKDMTLRRERYTDALKRVDECRRAVDSDGAG